MNLYEALSIPYARGVASVFDAERGMWVRRFEYLEISGCMVETDSTLEGLRELEIVRVARIVELMASGRPVPRPRPPLIGADVTLLLEKLALDIGADLLATQADRAATSSEFADLARRLAQRSTPQASVDG